MATGSAAQTNDLQRGILVISTAMLVLAVQDAVSRHLAATYDVFMITMIRLWFVALFAAAQGLFLAGGIKAVVSTKRPLLQMVRGALLATQICLFVSSFVLLGLIESHAVFAVSPLIVVGLTGVFLGENVDWRRWAAVAIGFVGVLIILRPGFGVFSLYALLPLAAALVFAVYVALTRVVARDDSAATSFFWAGAVGATVITPIGLWFWTPMAIEDWGVMALLCALTAAAHFLVIYAYAVSEASALQPFTYLQLVFASAIAVIFLEETLATNVALGAAIVVATGLFAIFAARKP